VGSYEFKFVVTDVELGKDEEERISQAVGQAGALALAEATPMDAITYRYGPNRWWRGIPPVELAGEIAAAAAAKVQEGGFDARS